MGAPVEALFAGANADNGRFAPCRPLPPLPASWRSLPRAFVIQARARWSLKPWPTARARA